MGSFLTYLSNDILLTKKVLLLTESKKSLRCKVLIFAISPKILEYADYLLPFELLYRDMHNIDITNEKKEISKTRIKDCAFSLLNSYNENGGPFRFNSIRFRSIKTTFKNKNSIIQKSDECNSIAIIDKIEKMRNNLSHSSKFTQVSVAEDKQLNFMVNIEKHITDLLKDLKNSEVISETVYKSLKNRGSRFGIPYCLSKVHKQLIDNCPPFRPIMSAIKTPIYHIYIIALFVSK